MHEYIVNKGKLKNSWASITPWIWMHVSAVTTSTPKPC